MRLTVFGASGAVGRQLVRRALDDGYEVTAVIRASPGSAVAVREWASSGAPVGAGLARTSDARLRVAVVEALRA